MRLRTAVLLALFFLMGSPGAPHGGGLDGYGCHHNRKQGGYHCHRGRLAGRHFYSQSAMLEELRRLGGGAKPREYDKAPQRRKPDPFASPQRPTEIELRDLTLTVQNLLLALGFNPGPRDGQLGAGTSYAIRQFQKSQGLPVDGRISGRLLVQLSEEVRRRGAP